MNKIAIKSVPELRFGEFSGNWDFKRLKELCSVITYGLTVRPSYHNEGIPLISAREIKKGVVNINDAPKISISDYQNLSDKTKPKKNDVFLSKTGTIGLSAIFDYDNDVAITQNIAILRLANPSKNIPIFLLAYLKTKSFLKSAISKVNQSTIMDLQLGDIGKLSIPLPPKYKEQQKIANFLTSVDQRISLLKQKKAALETYKKGLMQKIFNQEIRFKHNPKSPLSRGDSGVCSAQGSENYPDWEETIIADLCSVGTGNKDTKNKIDNGEFPFFVRSNTVERINSYAYDGKAILTSGDGVGVGKNYHFINGKFDFHQRVYALTEFSNKVIPKYLYIYFSNFFYRRVLRMSAKNSVDSVRMDMITKMPVLLPDIEEQQKIADCLSSMDQSINKLKKQIKQTTQFKKGLLQRMFV
jgi:type I restriction enzyme S subunit